MRPNKLVWGFLLLAFGGYVCSILASNALAYFLFFSLLVGGLSLKLLGTAINLSWKLLPRAYKKNNAEKKSYFSKVVFSCFILFYLLLGIVEETCLSCTPGFIGVLVKIITSAFVILLGWHLMRHSKAKTIVTNGILFAVLVLLLLSVKGHSNSRPDKIITNSQLRKLGGLGYVKWVNGPCTEENGVVLHNRQMSFGGINLYSSQTSPEAYLMDMEGNIIHKWANNVNCCDSWSGHVKLCENGDLLVTATDQMLICLDWNSMVKWITKIRVHHDFSIDKNGRIHALTRKRKVVFWKGIPVPIINDYITILSPAGKIKKEVGIYELVKERIKAARIAQIYKGMLKAFEPKNVARILMWRISKFKEEVLVWSDLDILHTNAIEVMGGNIEGFCKKHDLLISIRELDLVGVVDPGKKKLTWHWGPGELSKQHYPRLLKNHHVLIYDNGVEHGASRVIELDPHGRKIIWEYKSDTPEKFYSEIMGACQRLLNGNTLITESAKGHVFEITKDGMVVWDFYNPKVNEEKKREIIYRMMRITNPEVYEHLKVLGCGGEKAVEKAVFSEKKVINLIIQIF